MLLSPNHGEEAHERNIRVENNVKNIWRFTFCKFNHCTTYWWLVRVTLVIAFAFLPQSFESCNLWIIILLKNERNLSDVDTQTLPAGKKKLNFMYSQVVGMQKPSLSLALVPHTNHLVKLSLPNIYNSF